MKDKNMKDKSLAAKHFWFDLPENLGGLTDVKIQNGNNYWLVSGLRTRRDKKFLTLILFRDTGSKINGLMLHTDLVVNGQYEVCADPKLSLTLLPLV